MKRRSRESESARQATPPATLREIPIDKIRVGKRARKEMGDIDGLAASMAELNLPIPIGVRPTGDGRFELVFGGRRLAAAKQLGWSSIQATVREFTDDEALQAESAENVHRKGFTPSEAVAKQRQLEAIERKAAKQRQGKHPGNLPAGSTGRAGDRAAKATGWSRRTLEKAGAVVDAATAEPEKYGKLAEDMDRTGRADGPFKRLKDMQAAERIRAEPPPMPGNGPYRVGVIDVPWPFELDDEAPAGRGLRPYPTMSIGEIRALPIPTLMHADSVVWMWTTNHDIRAAYALLDDWGFEPKTILTWAKGRIGQGSWLRSQTEHCIMAVRGSPIVTLTNQTTLLQAPVGKHSAKPIEFYNLVESLCPAPRYLDMFSRHQHGPLWDCHGNEAPAAVSEAPVNGNDVDPQASADARKATYSTPAAAVSASPKPPPVVIRTADMPTPPPLPELDWEPIGWLGGQGFKAPIGNDGDRWFEISEDDEGIWTARLMPIGAIETEMRSREAAERACQRYARDRRLPIPDVDLSIPPYLDRRPKTH